MVFHPFLWSFSGTVIAAFAIGNLHFLIGNFEDVVLANKQISPKWGFVMETIWIIWNICARVRMPVSIFPTRPLLVATYHQQIPDYYSFNGLSPTGSCFKIFQKPDNLKNKPRDPDLKDSFTTGASCYQNRETCLFPAKTTEVVPIVWTIWRLNENTRWQVVWLLTDPQTNERLLHMKNRPNRKRTSKTMMWKC